MKGEPSTPEQSATTEFKGDGMTLVEQPYVIMFKPRGEKNIITHIYKGDIDHKGYGLLVCDLVRHVARAFDVDEDDVWEWVEKERRKPTTTFSSPS